MSHGLAYTAEVRVDVTNPGQFFACCGLLELADRLWKGAEGWFGHEAFRMRALGTATGVDTTLGGLVGSVRSISIRQAGSDDDPAAPIQLPCPFELRLDWWTDGQAGGKSLKVWAGSMGSVRIARAMHNALRQPAFLQDDLLNQALVVHDPEDVKKKVEPFYFDARRGANALPIDVGFSPDVLSMTTLAYPAVEFFCLVGLQRFRPMPTGVPRLFDYFPWTLPLDCRVAACAAVGLLPHARGRRYRFENAFRTDQRKHKAFTPATPL